MRSLSFSINRCVKIHVCVFIKLLITAQSGPFILHGHSTCATPCVPVCVCVCVLKVKAIDNMSTAAVVYSTSLLPLK